MARNLVPERSKERVLNGASLDSSSQVSKGSHHSTEGGQYEIEEFGEEDIWDVGAQNVEPDELAFLDNFRPPDDEGLPRSFSSKRRFGLDMENGRALGFGTSPRWSPGGRTLTASRNIPSQAAEHIPLRTLVQSSAPVNIPDWSKILGEAEKSTYTAKHREEEDDDDQVMVPPHVIVQRQSMRENDGLAMSFSVCEGAGRTLKGLDQTRFRNTVLRQTGFFDPWT
eukprot:TRINITY_DN5750_c0_g1_i1.p1 TRINITY_DN5750_c0_g1~~TRINITY_DN5750_c0_g1_i1.p1  ORF type:complete len:225 (+),score=43.59 TRINITY_DN5750_c0_g1_i1:118-792(+)